MSAESDQRLRKRYLELKRLRGNPAIEITDAAFLNTSMTYRELVHMVSMLESLLSISTLNFMDMREWADKATRTTARILIERDDARRELCIGLADHTHSTFTLPDGCLNHLRVERARGWDCFKESML
jgi:hypothetical protein